MGTKIFRLRIGLRVVACCTWGEDGWRGRAHPPARGGGAATQRRGDGESVERQGARGLVAGDRHPYPSPRRARSGIAARRPPVHCSGNAAAALSRPHATRALLVTSPRRKDDVAQKDPRADATPDHHSRIKLHCVANLHSDHS